MTWHEIDAAVIKVSLAEIELERAIRAMCPGEGHAYVQYRDGNPPWCRACEMTARGEVIRA